MKIGVLRVQGAFAEHEAVLRGIGVEVVPVRLPEHLEGLAGLVLPGGESTTMRKLIERWGLREPILELARSGAPVLGTCAGMILLAAEVLDGRTDQRNFGAIDVSVRRNAYGRQVDSFEADLDIDGLVGGPYRAVFIRAPGVERVGPAVEVLASVDDHPVLCSQGSVLVASFHPELTDDDRLHQRFLSLFLDLAA